MFGYLARHRLGTTFFLLIVVGSICSAAYFLYRGGRRAQHLYVPKLLMLRIDEVPFPKTGKKPVDVMHGNLVSLSCETIAPPAEMGKPAFRFLVNGKSHESNTCAFDTLISGEIDSTQRIGLDYLLHEPRGTVKTIDHWEGLIRQVKAGEYFRIHGLETPDAKPLRTLTVPREVVPFVDGAIKLPGKPEDYSVLFFVAQIGTDLPVLQAAGRPKAQDKFEVVTAPLKKYRRFGPMLSGVAAWPVEPIQVGSPEDERKIFEIYAGLFENKNVKAIVSQLLSFEGETPDGQAQIKVHAKRVAEIKALAWSNWLSEPIRVVRAAEFERDPFAPPIVRKPRR